MEPLLELSDVVKEFSSRPPVRPLDGLSMVVPPSTMIAVTGVSGKGKSTLLNVMGGLLRPEAGSVRYRKIDLTQATAAQIDDIHRRGIGFVFQTPYLFQALTAYENLELALRASGEKVVRDRIFEMLEKLGLSERAEHLPSALSAGQKRRLVLGRALLSHHDVLLADEPTSALDVTLQKQVVEEMRMVRDTFGTAIVLVAHNLGVIGAMADNVLVLKDGKTVEYGKTGDVLANPQADYTKALLAAVPRLRR